jgi:hypothetical protein
MSGTLKDWQRAYAALAVFAEQNPECFTASRRAALEAGYREISSPDR